MGGHYPYVARVGVSYTSHHVTRSMERGLNYIMNEEYAKQLMEERKGESPFKLWLEFIGIQLLFGLGLMVALLIVFGAIEWVG